MYSVLKMGGSLSTLIYPILFHAPYLNKRQREAYLQDEPGVKVCTIDPPEGPRIYLNLIEACPNPRWWLIWSHGNANHIGEMRPYFLYLSETLGCGIISYDYQGYGMSEGKASEKGCVEDLTKVVEGAKAWGIRVEQMILVGRSLGTGVTMEFAARTGWEQLIVLISPYLSITRVVAENWSELVRPFEVYPTYERIPELKCPVQLIHGLRDRLISPRHSEVLWASIRTNPSTSPAPVWLETDHNNILERIPVETWWTIFDQCK